MESTKETIKNFMSRYFNTDDLKDDDNIFETGLVSSLFSMQLLLFLETEFHVEIKNDDIVPENFKSVNNMITFLSEKGR